MIMFCDWLSETNEKQKSVINVCDSFFRKTVSIIVLLSFIVIIHPRPQAQAQAALTVALFQAVDLRRNSDAEAWSHSMCIAP
jgi:hypothetical protein